MCLKGLQLQQIYSNNVLEGGAPLERGLMWARNSLCARCRRNPVVYTYGLAALPGTFGGHWVATEAAVTKGVPPLGVYM